jgi:hypothetical protein
MREPHAFAKRDTFQDPVAVAGDERDSVAGHEPDSVAGHEPDGVADPMPLAGHLPE